MIAEDAEHTVGGGERLEGFRGRLHVVAVSPRDVVAAEDDEIGPLVHQAGGRTGDVFVRDPVAAVNVGDEPDAQSGQRGRQAEDGHGLARDLERVALVARSRTTPTPASAPAPVAARPFSTARRVSVIDCYSNRIDHVQSL